MLTVAALLEKPQVHDTHVHDPSIPHSLGLLLRHAVIRKYAVMISFRKQFSLPVAALVVTCLIALSSAAVLRRKVSLKSTEERRNILPDLGLRSLAEEESTEKPDEDGPLPFKAPPPPRVRQLTKKNAKRSQTKMQPHLSLYRAPPPK